MIEVDVTVIGGGPAGLTAALYLGRARRSVLLLDTGEGRNAATHAAHGFFTRDGASPAELRRIGRDQLATYPDVAVRDTGVLSARRHGDAFAIALHDGEQVRSRAVILATGVRDELPDIDGMAENWGRGVVSCPWCDGWELRDRPIAMMSSPTHMTMRIRLIHHLSRDLTVLTNRATNGVSDLDDEAKALVEREVIRVITDPITRVEGDGHHLTRITFATGEAIVREGLFAVPEWRPRNEIAVQLGCEIATEGPMPGMVVVDGMQRTSVPGVFAAGDLTTPGAQLTFAVSSGATAAMAIHHDLLMAAD